MSMLEGVLGCIRRVLVCLSSLLPVIVAVDIDVSNNGMPVKAPTKLFKLFDDERVFRGDFKGAFKGVFMGAHSFEGVFEGVLEYVLEACLLAALEKGENGGPLAIAVAVAVPVAVDVV